MARFFIAFTLLVLLAACGGGSPTLVVLTVSTEGEGRVSSLPPGLLDCGNDGSDGGGETCTTEVAAGTTVTLQATPAEGYGLIGWSVAACGEALTCPVTPLEPLSVTARFAPIYRVNAVLEGDGAGRVTSADDKVDCPDDCEGSYYPGATVILTATPAVGSVFAGWSGACSGEADCTLTITENAEVTATFEMEGAPVVTGLADQRIVQNAGDPQALAVPFMVSGEGQFTVTASSDAPALIGTPTVTCDAAGDCALTLMVVRHQASSAVVQVRAEDGAGRARTARFRLEVAPRLVTSAAGMGPGSLPQTLAEAEPGDVLAFDTAGAFAGAQTIPLTAQLTLDKPLTVQGLGPDLLTLQANGTRHLLVAPGVSASLSGLTLRGGSAQDGGGSVLQDSAGGAVANRGALTLVDVRLTDNEATHGGAVYNAAGASLTLRDAVLNENRAQSGGAVFNDSQAPAGAVLETVLVLESVQFLGNSAQNYGGALYNYEGGTAVTVADSRFEGNRAQSSSAINNGRLQCGNYPKSDPRYEDSCERRAGSMTLTGTLIRANVSEEVTIADGNGALSNFGVLTVTDSRFEANVGPSGAGLYNQFRSEATLTDVTFTDNRALLNGGGIFNEGALALVRVTVTANQAVSGAGVYNNGFVGTISLPAGNSVTGNTAQNLGGGLYNFGYGLPAGSVAAGVVTGNAPDDVVDERRSRLMRPILLQEHTGRRL